MPRLATAVIVVVLVAIAASSSVADSPHRAYLPLVTLPGGGWTHCQEPRIYDQFGAEKDWDWVTANYGAVAYWRQPGSACLAELREVEGPSTLIADVGVPGAEVVFYWPDAPFLSSELQNCGLDRGLIVAAKANGRAEFAMGGGSYYFPPIGGPHWIWVLGGPQHGDCLGGIGMLGLTNHKHLDSVWRVGAGW